MNWKKAALALTMVLTVALTGCISKVVEVEDVSRYVTLGTYKGVTYTPASTEVTQEQHDQNVQGVLQQHADVETLTEGTIEDGDTVVLDFTGYKDGVAFENGSATNQTVVLGQGLFIPGFEESIVGHEVGETFMIDVTFPEGYKNNPDLAGQPAQFEITVHSKAEYHLPELTDEFVAEIYGENDPPLTTVEEFNAYIDEQQLQLNRSNADDQRTNDVWQAVMDGCTFTELPKDKVQEYFDSGMSNVDAMVEYYSSAYGSDLTVEDLYGMSREELEAQIMASAEDACRDALAAEAIAYAEGIDVSDEELNAGASALASQYGYDSGDAMIEAVGKEEIFMSVLQNKVVQFVLDNAVPAA